MMISYQELVRTFLSYTVKVFITLHWVDKKKSWRIIDIIALCADVMSVTIKQVNYQPYTKSGM